MIRTGTSLVLVCACLFSTAAWAQDKSTGDEAVHDELRAMRKSLTEALTKGDIEGQLAHVHPNVVATWQNNRVVRGEDGLRKFLAEINAGNQKVFQGYTVPPEADELTILYGGDTGIAFGKSVPHYKYLGMEFDLENRWTATLVKDDGRWKIAAYHVSGNIADNPLLTVAKKSATWVGGVCLVVGIVVGSIVTMILKRKRPPKVTP
ncbi:MAG: nuclear transport factor 2 family protein [Planctomycetaceae bacterium]